MHKQPTHSMHGFSMLEQLRTAGGQRMFTGACLWLSVLHCLVEGKRLP